MKYVWCVIQVYKMHHIFIYSHGRPQGGGKRGHLPPPWKFTDMGGPPKDNLTRNLKKKIKGTPYSKRRN